MPIENDTVHWMQILKVLWLAQSRSYQKDPGKFWNENSINEITIVGQKRYKFGIYEHEKFSSDSIEYKVITTMKGEFYFTIEYNKQVN